eukprot:1178998-Rhodomonas_salina.1
MLDPRSQTQNPRPSTLDPASRTPDPTPSSQIHNLGSPFAGISVALSFWVMRPWRLRLLGAKGCQSCH